MYNFEDDYNCPITFEEIWTYITDKSVPGVVPYMYEISSFGNCFSFGKREQFLKPVQTKNGYWRYNLQHTDGTSRYHLIHRIVMIEFCCVPNYQKLQVDHYDNDKSENAIYNLQWVTGSTNIQRAYDTGVKHQKHGEDCSFATITNAQAEEVAKLLIQGLPHKEISSILNIPLYIIGNISTGATWRDVYEKYDLEKYKRVKPKVATFSDEDLHLLCKYFEDHPVFNYRYKTDLFREALMNLFGIEYTQSMSASMKRIFSHQTRRDITDQYNF